jgi:hypothetical protein
MGMPNIYQIITFKPHLSNIYKAKKMNWNKHKKDYQLEKQ